MLGLGTTELIVIVAVIGVIAFLVRRSKGDGRLVPCADCGHGVSPLAATCPHCGRPLQ